MKQQLTIEQTNELLDLGVDEDISMGNWEYPFETLFTIPDLITYLYSIPDIDLEMKTTNGEWVVSGNINGSIKKYKEKELVDALYLLTKSLYERHN